MNYIVIEGSTVIRKPDYLEQIGKGRSAVVYKLPDEDKALKVFYPDYLHLAELKLLFIKSWTITIIFRVSSKWEKVTSF